MVSMSRPRRYQQRRGHSVASASILGATAASASILGALANTDTFTAPATHSLAVNPLRPLLGQTLRRPIDAKRVTSSRYGPGTYPFWVFDWSRLLGLEPSVCAAALFVSGVLCSAAGIGGGGIYVSLLMVLGGLTTRDAVPLSKGIVFFGSLASLALNMKRAASGQGKKETVIHYGLCRIVVPSALVGTLFGVLLNHTAGDRSILLMLMGILSFMAFTSVRTTLRQYLAETRPAAGTHAVAAASVTGTRPVGSPWQRKDVVGGISMLLLTIACGTARFHMDSFRFIAANPTLAGNFKFLTLAVPMIVCLLATVYNTYECVGAECFLPGEVVKYVCMAAFTGCFAGLVGIGGGLIFSPFFLLMGVDPSVAVATSSTCVIFTSASTTFQYLLTGRIIMSLTVFYGITNLLASYCGTSLVHFLQDRFSGRRSYISGIVALAVVISSGLVATKLISA
eukprot:TRINITY_DN32209_c0_g1_i1.p1 TRINITY_DN32209_c0_g1~~TRINITY_DN32209_c0_g1_i1.p1  ORF type:complete len:461 (-),score=56.79 TRINITY_DN32209_c0_g1_i1:363-1721(-)